MGEPETPLGPNEFQLKQNIYTFGIDLRIPGPPTDPVALATWKSDIEARVHTILERLNQFQIRDTERVTSTANDEFLGPPIGFSFSYDGKAAMKREKTVLSVLPVDKATTVARILSLIKVCLRKDHDPPANYLTHDMKVEYEKKPIPPFSNVEVTGPNGFDLKVTLPTERSPQFQTAADVLRGQETAISDFTQRLERLVDALNTGKDLQ